MKERERETERVKVCVCVRISRYVDKFGPDFQKKSISFILIFLSLTFNGEKKTCYKTEKVFFTRNTIRKEGSSQLHELYVGLSANQT